MPAKSENQRKAAGAALAAKRGETDPDELYGAAKEMYDSMTESELEDFASKSESVTKDDIQQIAEQMDGEY